MLNEETDEYFVARPGVGAQPLTASGSLSRETLDAAFARLMEPPLPSAEFARAEMALVRWLDEQPAGTAEKLLGHLYGGADGRES
jgi:hypothetical protein